MFTFGSKMSKVCAPGQTVKGVDVSHYDEVIDWRKVQGTGIRFAFLKCTEGAFYTDKTYVRNKANARDAGLYIGPYHFFHPKNDPAAQASHFLERCGDLTKCLPPVLDWETTDNVPNTSDRAKAKIWLDTVEKATGKTPIIYLSPYFGQSLGLDSSFAKYPLWVAHYGVGCPLVPSPWKNWTFWQYSEKGNVDGIPAADEDLNLFNGSLDQLKALVGIV